MAPVVPMANRRAADRPLNPPCEDCGEKMGVSCVLRTTMVLYFRCPTCGLVWSVDKPPERALHTAFTSRLTAGLLRIR
jgi:uncharacterized Zn finger protein